MFDCHGPPQNTKIPKGFQMDQMYIGHQVNHESHPMRFIKIQLYDWELNSEVSSKKKSGGYCLVYHDWRISNRIYTEMARIWVIKEDYRNGNTKDLWAWTAIVGKSKYSVNKIYRRHHPWESWGQDTRRGGKG